MSQKLAEVKIPITMAVVLWKALRESNAPEVDLLAACMITQGYEIDGSPEEIYDYYKEYLIANGVIQ